MSIYDYKVKDRNGNEISLNEFKGKVLILLAASLQYSRCMFPGWELLEVV